MATAVNEMKPTPTEADLTRAREIVEDWYVGPGSEFPVGLVADIASALASSRLAGEQAGRKWQPIETAPKDNSWILAVMRTGRQTVIRWGGGTWEDDNRLCRDPIRWMPLPPAEVDGGKDGA